MAGSAFGGQRHRLQRRVRPEQGLEKNMTVSRRTALKLGLGASTLPLLPSTPLLAQELDPEVEAFQDGTRRALL